MMRKTKPSLQEQLQQNREELSNREILTISDAARRYSSANKEIESKLNALIILLQNQKLQGEPYQNTAFRIGRLQELKQQINDIVLSATKPIMNHIESDQSFAVSKAQSDSFSIVVDSIDNNLRNARISNVTAASVTTSWKTLPKEALHDLVGFMSSGKPLRQMLEAISQGTAEAVTKALFNGLALGKNPRVVAREAAKVTDLSLNRLMTISRTEMLRSYRESSRRAYVANTFHQQTQTHSKITNKKIDLDNDSVGFVKGWIWYCALDSHTCITCLAMHGTFHEPYEELDGHCNCRCAMVPVTASFEELGISGITETSLNIESGSDWFAKQSDAFQQNTLGPAKFHLYKGNRVIPEDFIQIKNNPIWGSMRVEAPVQTALQNASARRAIRN